MTLIFYIYIILQSFYAIFSSVCVKLQSTRRKHVTHSAIMFNRRRHDVTSVERFDNQWGRLFTRDVASRQCHMIHWLSSMYEPCWSKISSSKESLWQCKYLRFNKYISFFWGSSKYECNVSRAKGENEIHLLFSLSFLFIISEVLI